MPISIVPVGTKITDATTAQLLAGSYPQSFRKSQDVLVATKKYLKGPTFFRSQRSLIQRLQAEFHALADCLQNEGFLNDEATSERWYKWFSMFGQAFPNWQPEYQGLNSFLPQIALSSWKA